LWVEQNEITVELVLGDVRAHFAVDKEKTAICHIVWRSGETGKGL
jgi:hypothetical protein